MVSNKVIFVFRSLRTTEPVEELWQKLLKIEADFEITISGKTVLRDADFNVVEFASAVSKWLAASDTQDFSFSTMEADDLDIVFFRRSNAHWLVGSTWGLVEGISVVGDDLRSALEYFIAQVTSQCAVMLGVDVMDVVEVNRDKSRLRPSPRDAR